MRACKLVRHPMNYRDKLVLHMQHEVVRMVHEQGATPGIARFT